MFGRQIAHLARTSTSKTTTFSPLHFLSRASSTSSSSSSISPSPLSSEVNSFNPKQEGGSVSRIARLLEWSDHLARTNKSQGNASVPHRLRGASSSRNRGLDDKLKRTPPDQLKPLPTTRRVQDSYVQLDLKFSEDPVLRESYLGGLSKQPRMGRLMEDFDSVAGAATYRFVLPDGVAVSEAESYGLYLVTAAVDRMDVLKPLTQLHDGSVPDLRLSGHVSYASESSLEVFVQEEELVKMGKDMRENKKRRKAMSLETTPPSAAEAKMLHDLFVGKQEIFARNASCPDDVVFMADTALKSATLNHPTEANVHNKIFGGYLMRLAYETAFATACLFSRSTVHFIALDEIRFALPVEIGSLLLLDSKVTYSPIRGTHKSFHVSVEAATTDLFTVERRVTNTFHFTFASDRPLARHVLPKTYLDAISWLDAQRRREEGIAVRKAYDSEEV
ncbi:BZ3500_MvSof-1268-A1-R1_Chr5-2g08056 [Microbotryum saponariae]|uniref:BZ3500_MvSof-1268-A1-R1_Chr5-2g08056 protein n=1 Tax=Microbotryum saponariae TaxID=289078 RepID=A0A2X0M9N4_9BASI|nr:BZ3500_MvSof-1268-A1-R1_Chr5-2g08056 [Microbotryum saponariae]SDA05925.1 BZ3501_MvSof-1269-A2-R1_Chr5-2g07878 [Microbotryum saponariae]